MSKLIISLMIVICCTMSSQAEAGKRRPDSNIGLLVKTIKTLSDGGEVSLYKRTWIEARTVDQVDKPEWAGDWHNDLYSLVLKKKNSESSEVIYQMNNSWPINDTTGYPRITFDFLDIKLTGNKGVVIRSIGTMADALTFQWSDDDIEYISNYRIGDYYSSADIIISGEILSENTFLLKSRKIAEKWIIEDSDDKDAVNGKKAKLISRSKIADDAHLEQIRPSYRGIDPNIGSFAKIIKVLPDEGEVSLYERSWVGARTDEKVDKSEWAGDWHNDLYSIAFTMKGSKSSEVIYQLGSSWPINQTTEYPHTTYDILDIRITGDRQGIVMSSSGTMADISTFRWSRGIIAYFNYRIGDYSSADTIILGEILSENTFLLKSKQIAEKWIIENSNDKDAVNGKKVKLLSRSKIANCADSKSGNANDGK